MPRLSRVAKDSKPAEPEAAPSEGKTASERRIDWQQPPIPQDPNEPVAAGSSRMWIDVPPELLTLYNHVIADPVFDFRGTVAELLCLTTIEFFKLIPDGGHIGWIPNRLAPRRSAA